MQWWEYMTWVVGTPVPRDAREESSILRTEGECDWQPSTNLAVAPRAAGTKGWELVVVDGAGCTTSAARCVFKRPRPWEYDGVVAWASQESGELLAAPAIGDKSYGN